MGNPLLSQAVVLMIFSKILVHLSRKSKIKSKEMFLATRIIKREHFCRFRKNKHGFM